MPRQIVRVLRALLQTVPDADLILKRVQLLHFLLRDTLIVPEAGRDRFLLQDLDPFHLLGQVKAASVSC